MHTDKEIEDVLDLFSAQKYKLKQSYQDNLILSIAKFYDKYERHQYHSISKYISEKEMVDDDEISYLLNNIDYTKFLLRKDSNRMTELLQKENISISAHDLEIKLEKLYDHISLDETRLASNQRMINESKRMLEENILDTVNEVIRDLKSSFNELNNSQNANIITIVGIFSAIIFVFFGGISGISSVISSLKEIGDLNKLIFLCVIIGTIMFDIVFMLLYSISKMVDKNIGSTIKVEYYNGYYTRENENDSSIEIFDWETDEFVVRFRCRKEADRYIKRKSRFPRLCVVIRNSLRRLLLRFPVVSGFNIIAIISIIYFYNHIL